MHTKFIGFEIKQKVSNFSNVKLRTIITTIPLLLWFIEKVHKCTPKYPVRYCPMFCMKDVVLGVKNK